MSNMRNISCGDCGQDEFMCWSFVHKKVLFLLPKFPRAQKSTVQYRANLNPPMLIFPSEGV